MDVIKVCIGSGCHLNGSYEVIEEMKRLIAINQLNKCVGIKGSFCFGKCGDGVTILYKDKFYHVKINQVAAFIKEVGTNYENV
jgi:NADH:ubiquinone oxidoreductase subunit E